MTWIAIQIVSIAIQMTLIAIQVVLIAIQMTSIAIRLTLIAIQVVALAIQKVAIAIDLVVIAFETTLIASRTPSSEVCLRHATPPLVTVVWLTAEQPILGHRGLNWLVFLSLFGAGWWCTNRARGTT
jgi:hypothetical protein